jgi:hypothetical protein
MRTTIGILVALLLPSSALAQASTRTFYGAQGRITGTAATSNGITTLRDRMGARPALRNDSVRSALARRSQ